MEKGSLMWKLMLIQVVAWHRLCWFVWCLDDCVRSLLGCATMPCICRLGVNAAVNFVVYYMVSLFVFWSWGVPFSSGMFLAMHWWQYVSVEIVIILGGMWIIHETLLVGALCLVAADSANKVVGIRRNFVDLIGLDSVKGLKFRFVRLNGVVWIDKNAKLPIFSGSAGSTRSQ